jgi:hypothetical protein
VFCAFLGPETNCFVLGPQRENNLPRSFRLPQNGKLDDGRSTSICFTCGVAMGW